MDTDKYNWEIYTEKEKIAYREYLNGNKESIKDHNIIKDCSQEILFAMRLADIFFRVNPKGNVLDVGCGSGFMTHSFAALGYHVSGFDLTKEGVEAAKFNFPEIDFFIGNGVKPKEYFTHGSFDIIHIREFHPFKVINDFDYQINIIKEYLEMLTGNGIIIITQARPGIINYGGKAKKYDCLDYDLLKKFFSNTENILTAGPYFFFLLKHLKIIPVNKITIKSASRITKFLQILTRQSWVEFFLIYKK